MRTAIYTSPTLARPRIIRAQGRWTVVQPVECDLRLQTLVNLAAAWKHARHLNAAQTKG